MLLTFGYNTLKNTLKMNSFVIDKLPIVLGTEVF